MATRSLIPRLTDIIEAIERIHAVLADLPLDAFESDWQRQWLTERGVEIISEGRGSACVKLITLNEISSAVLCSRRPEPPFRLL